MTIFKKYVKFWSKIWESTQTHPKYTAPLTDKTCTFSFTRLHYKPLSFFFPPLHQQTLTPPPVLAKKISVSPFSLSLRRASLWNQPTPLSPSTDNSLKLYVKEVSVNAKDSLEDDNRGGEKENGIGAKMGMAAKTTPLPIISISPGTHLDRNMCHYLKLKMNI